LAQGDRVLKTVCQFWYQAEHPYNRFHGLEQREGEETEGERARESERAKEEHTTSSSRMSVLRLKL